MRTDPLGVTRLKQGRSGGRQLKKQKLPAEISALGRKRSPATLTLILDSLAQCPSKIRAVNIAGIHPNAVLLTPGGGESLPHRSDAAATGAANQTEFAK
jgi:hypothetical protein